MSTSICDRGAMCTNTARFYIHQSTIPQLLGNGEMETSPAGRSVLSCGQHLTYSVVMLGTLPFRTTDSVKVTLI
jgi:hypothetical protein